MGGKARRRREKNYRAAHGAHSRLPPPPDPSSIDAVPSKLRKLMALAHSSLPGSAKASVNSAERRKTDGSNKKYRSEDGFGTKTTEVIGEGNDEDLTSQHMDCGDEIMHNSMHEKRKKKRKRKQVDDLRFGTAEELGVLGSKRREQKKKRREARNQKHKKGKAEDNLDFPGCEQIKFGEIVEAPPKLVAVPKAWTTAQDASHQRLRLQAIEDYRNRKRWTSRPGINLPSPAITSPLI